jgi:hypothetical protein
MVIPGKPWNLARYSRVNLLPLVRYGMRATVWSIESPIPLICCSNSLLLGCLGRFGVGFKPLSLGEELCVGLKKPSYL